MRLKTPTYDHGVLAVAEAGIKQPDDPGPGRRYPTAWVLPEKGQSFPQAEIGLNSAVAAIGARNVLFDTCAVRHVGGYALAFGAGCRDNRVENCELVDLGGGGVKIGHAGAANEPVRAPRDADDAVSHHTVRNCTIAFGGRLHPAAVGVWIGHSPENLVEHNETTTSTTSITPASRSAGSGGTRRVRRTTTTSASTTSTRSARASSPTWAAFTRSASRPAQ